ncbi:uncharacterized protein V2V93DRAFT_382162 [Kockiozyma suomiensis]|uniref:uncharacterized protein n=1 Tax=Kockiozyma suomiensis TaxID=1337062 RepID=UPI003343F69F
MSFKLKIIFVPKSNSSRILVGQPLDNDLDVGAAVYAGKEVSVQVFNEASVLSPGSATGSFEVIGRLLSPLAREEVGTISCVGLNYKQHASEVNLAIPTVPTLFLKPNTALADPWPAPTILPKITVADGTGDYESELAVIISKEAKNISEEEAADYILGYTAANDSQWCFSKGFDGSCHLGPTIVSSLLISDPSVLRVGGLKNGRVLQDCGVDDVIFSIPKLISFLSQGTTLPAGTVIITGTPAGVGVSKKPQDFVKAGDKFAVEITPFIGTLMTEFENKE